MYQFKSLHRASSFAIRCGKPAFVFSGPESGYVVAIGCDARELMNDGHKPLSLSETSKAA